jgi:hypothetical protein
MPRSVARLLATRDRIDAEIRERIASKWDIIKEELGVPQDSRYAEPPARFDMVGAHLTFPVTVRAPKSFNRAERIAPMQVSIPAEAADCSPRKLRELLRRERPLRCSGCGLAHRAGLARCTSAAECSGALHWRNDAPRPAFYVEPAGTYGYFPKGPQPRHLRYAIDLSDYLLFGIQITLRHDNRWIDPIHEVAKDVLQRLQGTVALNLSRAINGELTAHASASRLSLHGPDWCMDRGRTKQMLLRSA